MKMSLCALNWIVPLAVCLSFTPGVPRPAHAATNSAPLNEHSQQLAQDRIQRENQKISQDPNAQPIAEALSAAQETRTAVQLLDQKKTDEAKSALTRALGKMDLALSNHPGVALLPLSLDLQIVDTQADNATLKRVTDEVKSLVKDGRYQAARLLLHDLASEIDVTTVSLPIATYPSAIRSASAMIDSGKLKEARAQLIAALDSLVVAERAVPLPVIRAQALTEEVSRQVSVGKVDKAQASSLLNEADQQLAYAEQLGYGDRKQDFTDLHASIQDAKRGISKGQETQNLLAKVQNGLEQMKEKTVG